MLLSCPAESAPSIRARARYNQNDALPIIGWPNTLDATEPGDFASIIFYFPTQPLQIMTFFSFYANNNLLDEPPGCYIPLGGSVTLYSGPVGSETITVVPPLHPNN
jgi:hypothetical protein